MGIYNKKGVPQANYAWNDYLRPKEASSSHNDHHDTARFSTQGTTMKKELFKFTTVKPDAVTIWSTLESADIEPSEGYTAFQIRFMMYCLLQLH
jgi:hypothetical protein